MYINNKLINNKKKIIVLSIILLIKEKKFFFDVRDLEPESDPIPLFPDPDPPDNSISKIIELVHLFWEYFFLGCATNGPEYNCARTGTKTYLIHPFVVDTIVYILQAQKIINNESEGDERVLRDWELLRKGTILMVYFHRQ